MIKMISYAAYADALTEKHIGDIYRHFDKLYLVINITACDKSFSIANYNAKRYKLLNLKSNQMEYVLSYPSSTIKYNG